MKTVKEIKAEIRRLVAKNIKNEYDFYISNELSRAQITKEIPKNEAKIEALRFVLELK